MVAGCQNIGTYLPQHYLRKEVLKSTNIGASSYNLSLRVVAAGVFEEGTSAVERKV
jgi:hypothetical protein